MNRQRVSARSKWRVLFAPAIALALLGGAAALVSSAAPAEAACSAPAWDSGSFYDEGANVSHNGHEWRANHGIWPGLEPGNSGAPPWWVPWQDLGPCSPSSTTTTSTPGSTTSTSTPGSTTTTTVPPGQSVEDTYSADGPWAVTTDAASVPGTPGATLHYPTDLGSNGQDHAIVTWANGSGGACGNTADTQERFASWGFVVVCPTTGEIVPDHVLAAADWAIAQNSDSSSVFYQNLDTGNVAAVGHSRGAGTSLAAAARDVDLFTAVIAANFTDRWTHGDTEGVDALSQLQNTSIFFPAGTSDFLVSEGEQAFFFDEAAGPAARAAVSGVGHNYIQEDGNAMQPYLTAWLKYTLEDDQFARNAFAGSDPEINTDPDWDWQEQKNLS